MLCPALTSPEEITEKQRTTIGAATFYAGGQTVYQHAHFGFGLENVSRQFVSSMLRSSVFDCEQSRALVRLARWPSFRHSAIVVALPEGEISSRRSLALERLSRTNPFCSRMTRAASQADIWNVGHVASKANREGGSGRPKNAPSKSLVTFYRGSGYDHGAHSSGVVLCAGLWRMQRPRHAHGGSRHHRPMVARVERVDSQFFDRLMAGLWRICPNGAEAPSTGGQLQARELMRALAPEPRNSSGCSSRRAPRDGPEAYRAPFGSAKPNVPTLRPWTDACSILPQSLSARNAERRGSRSADAPFAACQLHIAKKLSHSADHPDQRHRMVPGSRPLSCSPILPIPISSRPCS